MQPQSCLLCNSNAIKYLFTKQDIPFYKCKACGFIFSQPSINPNLHNTINDFEPAYLEYLGDQLHDKKNHDALLTKLKKHTVLQGEILDIGCGGGKFVNYLHSKGYNAVGIEPSAALFDAFLKNGDRFFNDDVFSFHSKHPQRKFNVIILADVLEHIERPVPFITTVSEMLSPQGIIFISTPDSGSVFAQLAGKRWHYYNRYHLSLFSKANLDKLMQQTESKFQKLDSGHVTRYQSFYYILKYGLNFLLHVNKGVPRFFSSLHLPVNFFDNMYAIYRFSPDRKFS